MRFTLKKVPSKITFYGSSSLLSQTMQFIVIQIIVLSFFGLITIILIAGCLRDFWCQHKNTNNVNIDEEERLLQ